MKKLIFITKLFIAAASMYVQDITGTWNGVLVVPGAELRVDFNISESDDGYTSTMDSPDQGAYGIPVTTTKFENNELSITVEDLTIVYKAKLNDDGVFKGKFTQMGQTYDMDLTKKKEE